MKKLGFELTLAARNGAVHDFRRLFLLRIEWEADYIPRGLVVGAHSPHERSCDG